MSPWTVARQAPLSMGFSRQEYWSGLPFPSPGDLPNPGIKPLSFVSPTLARVPPGKPDLYLLIILTICPWGEGCCSSPFKKQENWDAHTEIRGKDDKQHPTWFSYLSFAFSSSLSTTLDSSKVKILLCCSRNQSLFLSSWLLAFILSPCSVPLSHGYPCLGRNMMEN